MGLKITNDSFRPDISVIVTAYNRTKFLEYSIDSVLQQNLKGIKIEIIVVTNFDFAVDASKDIKIKKIVMEGTIGQFLYEGIKEASGELIAFLDDDDLWEKDKVKRVIEAFSDGKIVFYHNLYSYIDSQGEPVDFVRKVEKNSKNSFTSELVFNPSFNPDELENAIEMKADFNLSCIAVRKNLAVEYMDILKMITGCPDGFFFWIAVISKGYLFIDNEHLNQYRVHSLNTTGLKNVERKVSELQKEIMTFDLLIDLIKYGSYENNYLKDIKGWLELYKYEYQIIMLVFNNERKLSILNSVMRVIDSGGKKKNILKKRVLLFGLIGFISSRFAKRVYEKIR